jgi:ankyrin repeat protein
MYRQLIGDNTGYLFKEIIESLINHGADISIKDANGKTCLDYLKKFPEEYNLGNKYI